MEDGNYDSISIRDCRYKTYTLRRCRYISHFDDRSKIIKITDAKLRKILENVDEAKYLYYIGKKKRTLVIIT